MDVPNETIMANAIADRLRTDRFASIRDVFISVHLFEPKFPVGWFSFSISCCLKVAKRRTVAAAFCRVYSKGILKSALRVQHPLAVALGTGRTWDSVVGHDSESIIIRGWRKSVAMSHPFQLGVA